MKTCDEVQGLIAASLYEPLNPMEQRRLDVHLEGCPACRTDLEELRAFVASVPSEPAPALGQDLLPGLRVRISKSPARAWGRWAGALAAGLVLVAAAGLSLARFAPPSNPEMTAAAPSPAEGAVRSAQALIGHRDYATALRVLEGALKAYPDDPHAGELQLLLADLEFTHLQRYARASEAYERAKRVYRDAWQASPGAIKDRVDLLDEARTDQFQTLYALDAARASGGEAFGQLEQLVARHRGKVVAEWAVDAMARLVDDDALDAPQSRVAALERVRARCGDPIARTQVSYVLGTEYWEGLQDLPRARAEFTGVAGSGTGELAQMAQAMLAKLGSAP